MNNNNEFSKKDKNGCLFFLALCLIIFPLVFLTNKNKKDSSSFGSSFNTVQSSDRGYSGRNTWARRNLDKRIEERKKKEIEEHNRKQHENTMSSMKNMPIYPSSSSKKENKYSELWDECDNLSSILSDHDIDHDEPSYPMDYDDLKNLRDDLQNLLEENDIDY